MDIDTCSWEPGRDNFYYGTVPPGVSYTKLVQIMAFGVYRYLEDIRTHREKCGLSDCCVVDVDIGGILDSWFEHDSNTVHLFDYIVPEQAFDRFVTDVTSYINPNTVSYSSTGFINTDMQVD